ncbi:uncharacterized protein LOC143907092 [Temnothorax americanus]|uniref:uncharacterized protein LOC143907092 n=1 Tax=Temnothorax americanus TaxID=1964332 RepID=UPI0040694C7D
MPPIRHCLRRTSATLLSNSGANITMLKQLEGWKSAGIAEGYIENSLLNRQKIFDNITHAANANSQSHPQPSTSGTNSSNPTNFDKKKGISTNRHRLR